MENGPARPLLVRRIWDAGKKPMTFCFGGNADQCVVHCKVTSHNNGMIRKGVASLVLSGLLLLAQAHGLEHQLDIDAHADGGACEICLALGALDHGLPATLPALPLYQGQSAPPPARPVELLFQATTAYRSRAPPSSSFPERHRSPPPSGWAARPCYLLYGD